MKTIETRVAILLAALLCAACATPPAREPTLYEQLGGQGGIETITDNFLGNLAVDTRIAHFFADTDIPKFRSMLIKQFCSVAAGPCSYDGKSMYEAHQKKHIKDADFNALVEDLQKAMDDAHVARGAQARFLAQLVPMHQDIVNH